jgi:hypothetical protein
VDHALVAGIVDLREAEGRAVGQVGIVTVEEQEEGFAVQGIEPLDRRGHRPVERGETGHAAIGLEPPPQAEVGRKLAVADEGGRAVPAIGQVLGERVELPGQGLGNLEHPVVQWEERGEDGRVGRQAEAGLGNGIPEDGAGAGQGVEVGRGLPGIAMAVHVVGPERIDEDNDDVWRLARLRAAGGRVAGPRSEEDQSGAYEPRGHQERRSTVHGGECIRGGVRGKGWGLGNGATAG